MNQNCQNCRFGHFRKGQTEGECRHHSPCWSGLIQHPVGRFPGVGMLDWCGDWDMRETEQISER
jgi:hypothetical protein